MDNQSINPSPDLHSYGGYDPNESRWIVPVNKPHKPNPCDASFQSPFPTRPEHQSSCDALDPVTKQFRRFIVHPELSEADVQTPETQDQTCCHSDQPEQPEERRNPYRNRPIDPVHWDAHLFDTRSDKYYLKNTLNSNPYRKYLTTYYSQQLNDSFITEYKHAFSGTPALDCLYKTTYGLSRPADLPEPMPWPRYVTSKLRDSVFSKSVTFDRDAKDPKHYDAWKTQVHGHKLLLSKDTTRAHDRPATVSVARGINRTWVA